MKTKRIAGSMMMAVAGLVLCVSTVMANKPSRRSGRTVPDTVVVTRTDTVFITSPAAENLPEGEDAEFAYISNSYQLEAYKLKMQAKMEEDQRKDAREVEERTYKRNLDRDWTRNEQIFRIISKYSSLLAVWLVPVAIVFFYVYHQRRRREQIEMVFDMMRSGIDVTPAQLAALGIGSSPLWQQMANGMNTIMNSGESVDSTDIATSEYCMKRIVWGVIVLVAGFALACSSNSGVFFFIGLLVAAVMFGQAFIRYRINRVIIKKQNKNSTTRTKGQSDADV